jgi:hypothetical protein
LVLMLDPSVCLHSSLALLVAQMPGKNIVNTLDARLGDLRHKLRCCLAHARTPGMSSRACRNYGHRRAISLSPERGSTVEHLAAARASPGRRNVLHCFSKDLASLRSPHLPGIASDALNQRRKTRDAVARMSEG